MVSVSSPVVVTGPGVVFAAPGQGPGGQAGRGGGLEVDGAGGLVDGGGEQVEGGPGGRGRGRPGGAVEPDDGVEVDDAAPLVFGDLGVGDPELGGERLVGEPGLAGEGPAEGDGEAPPQFGGAGVEQDRAGVVVAVRAQRLAEPGVVAGVLRGRTGGRHAGRSGRVGGVGNARARPSFSRWTWTGPNDGAVSVVKTHGWVATVSGMPLPPVSPARMSW